MVVGGGGGERPPLLRRRQLREDHGPRAAAAAATRAGPSRTRGDPASAIHARPARPTSLPDPAAPLAQPETASTRPLAPSQRMAARASVDGRAAGQSDGEGVACWTLGVGSACQCGTCGRVSGRAVGQRRRWLRQAACGGRASMGACVSASRSRGGRAVAHRHGACGIRLCVAGSKGPWGPHAEPDVRLRVATCRLALGGPAHAMRLALCRLPGLSSRVARPVREAWVRSGGGIRASTQGWAGAGWCGNRHGPDAELSQILGWASGGRFGLVGQRAVGNPTLQAATSGESAQHAPALDRL